MTAYIASPTLSSPSRYAPTFHGHGYGHYRGAPSIALTASGSISSHAPLRSALARRAQASEHVRMPSIAQQSPVSGIGIGGLGARGIASRTYDQRPAAAFASAVESPASYRTQDLLSDSSCANPSRASAPASQAASYAAANRTSATARAYTLSSGADGVMDLDKQYEYGRLQRKASQSLAGTRGVSPHKGPESPYSGPYSSFSAVHHDRTAQAPRGNGTGGSRQESGAEARRYTMATSPSDSDALSRGSTPRQAHITQGQRAIQHQVRSLMMPSDGYGQSYASPSDTERRVSPQGDIAVQRHKRMSSEYGEAITFGQGDDRSGGSARGRYKRTSTGSISTTRPSPSDRVGGPVGGHRKGQSVYSPSDTARRISQYGLSAPWAWRGLGAASSNQATAAQGVRSSAHDESPGNESSRANDEAGEGDQSAGLGFALESRRREDGNRPSSYLRSGPRLTKYADFDFGQLESATETGAVATRTAGQKSKNGKGKNSEPESFLNLDFGGSWGTSTASAGSTSSNGPGTVGGATGGLSGLSKQATRMMKLSTGASKWVRGGGGGGGSAASGVGGMKTNGSVSTSGRVSEDTGAHSFFDGYSSRSTKPSSSGATSKSRSPVEISPVPATGTRTSGYARQHSTNARITITTTATLSPSASTDSKWSISTTRRAHAERLLPSAAVRSDSRTLLQGLHLVPGLGTGLGLDGKCVTLPIRVGEPGRTERALSVGTTLEAPSALPRQLYAANGSAESDRSISSTGTERSEVASITSGADSVAGSASASVSGVSDATTGSKSAVSDQVITPDLSVSYSGPSDYYGLGLTHALGSPMIPMEPLALGSKPGTETARLQPSSGATTPADRPLMSAGSPGFGLISLEAAQAREGERSRSGQPVAVSISTPTPRASESSKHLPLHEVTKGAKQDVQMPAVPCSSTSTIAQKIKSKKSLIALIKSATSSAAASLGGGGGGNGAVAGVTAPGLSTLGMPPLPHVGARRSGLSGGGTSIKSLIGDPIPLIDLQEGSGGAWPGSRLAGDPATPRMYPHGGDGYGRRSGKVDDDEVEVVDDVAQADDDAGVMRQTADTHLESSLSLLQPKLELRPVSMNFAHVMPEGYLVTDYQHVVPDVLSVGDTTALSGTTHAISFNAAADAQVTSSAGFTAAAQSSRSLSTSSSSYPGTTYADAPAASLAAPSGVCTKEAETLQRELVNLRKLHAMQLSELSSQLREAKDELSILGAEHLDVLEELAETAAIAAAVVTQRSQSGARAGCIGGSGSSWAPKEGGCAICGCTCGLRHVEKEVDMVVSENLMGSPSNRKISSIGPNGSGSSGTACVRGRHRSQQSASASGNHNHSYSHSRATAGRARSGTLKGSIAGGDGAGGGLRGAQKGAGSGGSTTGNNGIGIKAHGTARGEGNAVYPALAAPPASSGVDGSGEASSRLMAAEGGATKKPGVMDRARVKTGGARGFGTGSLYQWQ